MVEMLKARDLETVYSNAQEVYSTAIKAVCPVTLVSQSLEFDRASNILTVKDKTYQLSRLTLKTLHSRYLDLI